MQTVSRYLLTNTVILYQSGYHGRNSKVYDRRLKIYRGVRNPITFTFKNEDQKKQNIVGKSYTFNIIDSESKKAVLTRNLTVLDDGSTISSKGNASVEITDGDLLALNSKFYEYSINEVKSDGSTLVTFADTSYVCSGTIELLDGAYPQFTASTSVSAFTLSGDVFTSSNINAKPQINNNKALHTIAIYPNNFSGTLTVEGTMVGTSPTDNDYFTITSTSLSGASTVSSLNFTGVFQNVRFKAERTSGTTGRIDKILYRQ